MPSISINPVILSQFKRKNGTYPIKIRVCFKRKSKIILTNITARQDQLTKKLEIRDVLLKDRVDSLVRKMTMAANSIDLYALESMDVENVVQNIQHIIVKEDKPAFSLEFFRYAESIADEKKKDSRTNYMCAIHALQSFVGAKEMDISLISSSMMNNFEEHLKRKHGERARAVSLYTAAIAYIHKRARQQYNDEELGVINIRNPFSYYTPPKQKASRHRDLDTTIIGDMIKHRKSLSGRERLGVDLFLISFALMGMNTPDLYYCEPPVRGVLVYERTKTKDRRDDNAEMHVRIEPLVKNLLNEYADPDKKRMFNFYHRFSLYKSLGRAANIGLEQFRIRMGYRDEIHVYSARHTWGTTAYSLGYDKTIINDCLCHVDPNMRVTDTYIRKDWGVMWDVNKNIISEVGFQNL